MSKYAVLALSLAGCFHAGAPGTSSPTDVQSQQRAAIAQGMGFPTKKSASDLDAAAAQQTKDYANSGVKVTLALATPAPLSINADAGVCYTLVGHLATGAAWGPGAEAGLKFQYQSTTGNGTAGPGVVGPGAVVALDCAQVAGPIQLAVAPMLEGDTAAIGSGDLELEIWTHKLSAAEASHRNADKEQQITEQKNAAAADAEKQHQKEASGCSLCETRYQGCLGAGIAQASCQKKYDSCAFEEAGANWMSACSAHKR